MIHIPAHIVSEAKNDIKRRFGLSWEAVLDVLAEEGFAPQANATGGEIFKAVYAAAEALARRNAVQ